MLQYYRDGRNIIFRADKDTNGGWCLPHAFDYEHRVQSLLQLVRDERKEAGLCYSAMNVIFFGGCKDHFVMRREKVAKLFKKHRFNLIFLFQNVCEDGIEIAWQQFGKKWERPTPKKISA